MTETEIAEMVAIVAHYGQQTKSEGMRFIEHPKAVAAAVPDEYKAAAWLHDVLEDSALTDAHLLAVGITPRTIDIVKILTRTEPYTYDAYITNIIESRNIGALTVKLADLRHNLRPSCPDSQRARYEAAESRLSAILPADDRYVASNVVPTYTMQPPENLNDSLRTLRETEAAGILISRQDAEQLQAKVAALEAALAGVRSTSRAGACWCDGARDIKGSGHQDKCIAATRALLNATWLADQTPETKEP